MTTAASYRGPRSLLPRRSDYSGLRRSWPRDLAAGVTVGIVALPLALGFAVATGVGASVGLVTAVIAGTVAAVFGERTRMPEASGAGPLPIGRVSVAGISSPSCANTV